VATFDAENSENKRKSVNVYVILVCGEIEINWRSSGEIHTPASETDLGPGKREMYLRTKVDELRHTSQQQIYCWSAGMARPVVVLSCAVYSTLYYRQYVILRRRNGQSTLRNLTVTNFTTKAWII